jgi:hypothetical protein
VICFLSAFDLRVNNNHAGEMHLRFGEQYFQHINQKMDMHSMHFRAISIMIDQITYDHEIWRVGGMI